MTADGRVAVRNVLRGTHTGEFRGVPASGRPVEVMSNELYRVVDGLVVEEWIVTDVAGLFAQLGGGPPAAAEHWTPLVRTPPGWPGWSAPRRRAGR